MVIRFLVVFGVFIFVASRGYCLGEAEIIYLRGKVEICSSSMQSVQVAKKGDLILGQQGIKTYMDGLLILKLEDSSLVKIDPNSVVLVETLIKKDKNKLKGYSGFQLNAGAVMVSAHKSNFPRINGTYGQLEIRYRDTVVELSKGKLLVGIDLVHNNLWVSAKEGRFKIINFIWGQYIDLQFGYSAWVLHGQRLSSPDKYAWPLRLNWQMNPEKNVRLQSNFYALEITRQDEWKVKTEQASSMKSKSFTKLSINRMKDLNNKKIETEESFAKFISQTQPEKISILDDEISTLKNKKLRSSGQKGILDFN
ncbi:MAG: hypothetical protein A2381_07055 [Bdellovibrionales bacterium RIFOXYB1_FULL_37_110]|nr:MAG: hypothetical protein A2417_14930 [Bdellovibrionales bacterium RIFOXYC1_FULL_37_79]OFZ57820.1 MAG: hypothetical protein A2381_07055 [Bdellovibrionales bacterium RIFOXYB1_FULL_37_110]OFZ62786.1 MAG: hypothetical protein A2577_16575 [Bdellovibrionales bacterium RIFOXYD1_FULL_36_51]